MIRSPNIIVDWKNLLRDVCIEELLSNPELLGGTGKIVEIDESKFGKRQYTAVDSNRVMGIRYRPD